MINDYLFLKLLHELAAFWFIAGILGRQFVRATARRSINIHRFADLSELAGRFEALAVTPGNAFVIVFVLLLAWRGGWPILGFLQGAEANWIAVHPGINGAQTILIYATFISAILLSTIRLSTIRLRILPARAAFSSAESSSMPKSELNTLSCWSSKGTPRGRGAICQWT